MQMKKLKCHSFSNHCLKSGDVIRGKKTSKSSLSTFTIACKAGVKIPKNITREASMLFLPKCPIYGTTNQLMRGSYFFSNLKNLAHYFTV